MFLTKRGTNVPQMARLLYPRGVAFDSAGNVYIAESGNNRVQKFTSSGVFLSKWGSYGSGDGQFYGPWGVAFDSAGNVYIAEIGNNRVQKFTQSGSVSD